MHGFGDHKVSINKDEKIYFARGNSKSRTSMVILLEHLKSKYPEDKETIQCFIELVKKM